MFKSSLCCHALENSHVVDWNNTKIIFKEQNWKKRCLVASAAMLLQKETPISNPSIDLKSIYLPVLKLDKLNF